ncbi:MAG: hypothetical protein V3S37_01810 [Dehalococcoidia bacterium]
MGRFIVITAFLLSVIMPPLAAVPAYACSCASRDPAQSESFADVIVIGTVESIDITPPGADGTWSSLDPAFVSVAVHRYLKGNGSVDLEFSTARSGASCGALEVLDVGNRYLLFLKDDGSNYTTSLCSGNTALDGPAGVEYLREVEAITGLGTLPDGQAEIFIRGPGFEADPSFIVLGVAIFSPWKLLIAGIVGVLALLGAASLVFWRSAHAKGTEE